MVIPLAVVFAGMVALVLFSLAALPVYSPSTMKSGMTSIKHSYAAQGIQVIWPYQENGGRVKQVIPAAYSDDQARDVMLKLTDDYERVRVESGAGRGGTVYQFDDAGRPRGETGVHD